MPPDHPTPEELELFLLNRLDPRQPGRKREVARHLLSGCASCSRQLRALGWDDERLDRLLILPSPKDERVTADAAEPAADRERNPSSRRRQRYDYDRAFARAEEAVAELLAHGEPSDPRAARELAPLVAELDSTPAEEQERRVLDDARLARPRLVHHFIARSQRARSRDPLTMLRQANLARLTAEACSAPVAGGARRLADLRALAWSEYGLALRVGARWSEASRAFTEAEHWRARGTGDPLLRAALLRHLIISLRREERGREESLDLARDAERIYRLLGRERELAVALHDLSLLYAELGDADRAVSVLSHGADPSTSRHAPGLLRRRTLA
jgi:hypothetical protein